MDKPCIARVASAPARVSGQRSFPDRYQAVNNAEHAQKAWTSLWKSCQQMPAGLVSAEFWSAVRYPYAQAGGLAYPPATEAREGERLGICTEDVDETVHRLFDEGARPELLRPAGRRIKIEQDQRDRSGLCTNTVGGAVQGLWKHGARPVPMGLRRQRLLFAQRRLKA